MNTGALQPLDEGFSEDTQSQPGSDMAPDMPDNHYDHLKALAYALSDKQRLQLIKDVAASLSIEMLYVLHNDVGSMVYFDPVTYLPNELILQIFSLLSPKDLLTASVISKPWRDRTQDERLWRDNFKREGWIVDRAKFTEPEDMAKRKGIQVAERIMRTDLRPSLAVGRRHSRKRARDEAFSENEGAQQEQAEASSSRTDTEPHEGSEHMEGVESTDPVTAQDGLMELDSRPSTPAVDSAMDSPTGSNTAMVKVKPTVFTTIREPKISWPWLYKQRRRLERNWDTGTCTKFRLPHPDHPEEGHGECVYTIQHSGDHLVSGSRDKTIRVWDLKTQRLRLKPLQGHDASVLCLQFDEKPGDDHDLIVSGGSDDYIMVWRFSTGKLIRKITHAEKGHHESVLNLRFDDRYLVTCSKDKTIKIWNRHEISRNDPIIPARQLPKFDAEIDRGLPIPAFTCLDTLEGHQAAVNAVQIHGDIIVSASGDRTIKSWNIHNQKQGPNHKRSYTGHTKGIACVQFDGRRIVSGSSDNSVRIFDYETTAEVACLEGHGNLVRTVQARFGDLDILTDEDLLDESKAADRRFAKAIGRGMRPAEVSRRRGPRNAGSSRPEDMLSFGTKIPPGGGGSKWAKIVSGSYDESIIIWKKDPGKANKWRLNQRLQQGQPVATPSQRLRANANNANAQNQGQQPTPHANQLLQQAHGHLTMGTNLLAQPQVGHGHGLPHSQLTALAAVQNTLNHHIQNYASQQHQHAIAHGAAAATAPTAAAQVALANLNAAAQQLHTQALQAANAANAQAQQNAQQASAPQQQQQQQQQAPQAAAQATQVATPANPAAQGQGPAQVQAQAQGAPAAVGPQNPPQAGPAAHHHHHGHHHHHHGHAGQRGESNRVFKLQFDARRIIACSQNRIIVGWDFADGDKDLEWVGDWSIETP